MAVRLFIGNLPYDVTEAELRALCAAVGPLAALALPTDRDTGRPRGFAFVEFSRPGRPEAAIRHLHNQAFKGRPLAVSEARAGTIVRPQVPRPRGASPRDVGGHERRRPPALGPDAAPRRRLHAGEGRGESRARTEASHVQACYRPQHFGAEDDDADEEGAAHTGRVAKNTRSMTTRRRRSAYGRER